MSVVAFLPIIGKALDLLIPDPQQKAEAKLKMMELVQSGELSVLTAETELAKGQMDVNKAEATTDLFRGGWRPAVGWTCVAGLGYQFLIMPIFPWFVQVFGGNVPPLPPIDNETLTTLLYGMLGLGGLRTIEKVKYKG